jgi:hypothetical protein
MEFNTARTTRTTQTTQTANANAAIRDIHEKIEARKFQSYEIRDPHGILELLNIIDDTNATSLRIMGIMRSRL